MVKCFEVEPYCNNNLHYSSFYFRQLKDFILTGSPSLITPLRQENIATSTQMVKKCEYFHFYSSTDSTSELFFFLILIYISKTCETKLLLPLMAVEGCMKQLTFTANSCTSFSPSEITCKMAINCWKAGKGELKLLNKPFWKLVFQKKDPMDEKYSHSRVPPLLQSFP